MHFTKKSMLAVAALSLTVIIGGTAYAYNVIDFSSRAKSWTSETCTKALTTSKNSLSNNEKATICYNFIKANEQQISLDKQQLSIEDLYKLASSPGPKGDTGSQGPVGLTGPQGVAGISGESGPMLLDGNNKFLGNLITPSNLSIYGSIAFYSKSLNLIVPIDNQGVVARGNYLMGWTGANCTGIPYLMQGNSGDTITILDTMTLVQINGRYYTPKPNYSNQNIVSVENYAGNCSSASLYLYVLEVQLLPSLPFSQPILPPIQIGSM